jgi:Zn-dependent peptidase ImmA (M78 family)/transposase-like protein
MRNGQRGRYTLEFKKEAVRPVESGQSIAAAARDLGVVEQTLFNWIKAHRAGKLMDQLDLKQIGARLSDARRSARMTQQETAVALGFARTKVMTIEKGERKTTPHELIAFAKAYRCPLSDIVGRPIVSESFVPQFRSSQGTAKMEDAIANLAQILQSLSEDFVALEKLRADPLMRNYPNQYQTSGGIPDQVAEDVATAERNRLGLGDGPIGNLRELLASDVGLRIFAFEMPSQFAGLFGYNEDLGASVGINSRHPRDRRNWSLAHEYGHFLTTRYAPEVTMLAVSGRSNRRERLADAFARHFLMPASGLNRRFAELHRSSKSGITLAHVCTLANLYQVSVQALMLRLEELRRLPTGTWEQLKDEGFKVQHAQAVPGIDGISAPVELLPERYVNLAISAFQAGQISEGQLANYLRSTRLAARELFEASEHRIHFEDNGSFKTFTADLAQALGGR